jgi:hypothetical protein
MTIITPTGITGINSITSSGSTLVFQSAIGTPPTVTGLNNISSSGIITATGFVGNVTGNVTGNVAGNITGNVAGNVTGNVNSSGVSTITTLQTGAIQTTAGKPLLNTTGSIIQVVYASTGFVRQTISSASPVAVNGLSCTITPTSSTSRIIITAELTGSWTYVASMTIFRNGASLIANHGGNNQTGTGPIADFTLYNTGATTSNYIHRYPLIYQDTPGSTSAQTYQIYANAGWNGGTNAFYVNDRDSADMLSQSCMYVMEVTG